MRFPLTPLPSHTAFLSTLFRHRRVFGLTLVLALLGVTLAKWHVQAGRWFGFSTVAATTPVAFAPTTVTFNYTGATQTWTVPAGVTSISIEAYGAQGNSNVRGTGAGGKGGKATGTLAVTPGEVLYIEVGGGGQTSKDGGYNGGGNAGASNCTACMGGGGGGASDVRQGGTGLDKRVIVAGGGGGGGGNRVKDNGRGTGGGGGGGLYGGGGGAAYPNRSVRVATGGTQTQGGTGGTSDYTAISNGRNNGKAGTLGVGGDGGIETTSSQQSDNNGPVGGNGGGDTGSSGQTLAQRTFTGQSGAGGSGYLGGVTNGQMEGGVQTGNGQIIISYTSSLTPTTAPQIDIKGNNTDITSGDTTPSTADHTDFGAANVPGGTVMRTFTIENMGDATLNLTGSPLVSINGTNASDFIVSTTPSASVSANSSTTFTITFTPSAPGQRTANVSIANDVSGKSPYTFAIQGTGISPVPDITVKGNSSTIPHNDMTPNSADGTDFGSVNEIGATVMRTFTIENPGTGNLTLNGNPLVEIGGTNPADFTVSLAPTSPVTASSFTTFTITFDPSAPGPRTATVSIANDVSGKTPYTFAIQGTGVMASPDIEVTGNTNLIANGSTMPSTTNFTDLGSQDVSSGSIMRSFRIANNGSGTLNLTGAPLVAISGANASDFTVSTAPTSPVAANANTTFTITFDPSGAGPRTATVSIANDDSNNNPYTFAIQGTGLVPEINVQGNNTTIASGDTTPATADDTDFGDVLVLSGVKMNTFTIENLSGGTLNLTGNPRVRISGTNAADFTVTIQPPTSVSGNGTATFTITFDPSVRGLRTATVTIANDDSDEGMYTFDIQGTGLAPRFTVLGNGQTIATGDTTPNFQDHTDFGAAVVGSATITRTFTIQNTGNSPLNFSGTPKVAITGPNAGDYSLTTDATSPVTFPNGTTTFTIKFTPSALGLRLATVSIANDDPDKTAYTFAIHASGVDTPPMKVVVGDPAVCLEPGGLIGHEITLTNPNNADAAATLTSNLPGGLTAVAGSCVANVPGTCTVSPDGSSVTWDGNLPALTTVTMHYRSRAIANATNGTQFCLNNQGIVAGVVGNLQFCFTLNCPITDTRVSDTKAGSVLVFPYYTSTVGGASDTRMTISNVSNAASTTANQTYVHLFLINGTTCQQADFFLCLTPNASFSFKASEYDPDNTGYAIAVAVDAQGLPVNSNVLVGNAFVTTPTLADNYDAESFRANTFSAGLYTVSGNAATLFFDHTGYDAVPKQFAVEIQSPIDAAGQQVVISGLSGNLITGQITGAAQVGTGLAFNEKEAFASFNSWLTGACQTRATIATNSPRVPNGLGNLIKTGQAGTLKFNVSAAVGLLLTPRTATWKGIRTLHKTQTATTTLTIPIFIPVC